MLLMQWEMLKIGILIQKEFDMSQPRKRKMTVWVTDDDYKFWENIAWENHSPMSLFVNDQLVMVRRKIEQEKARSNQPVQTNMSNQRKPPTLQPRFGRDGNHGGLNNDM